MGKVKLTQVQADVIEQKKKYDGRGIQAILRDIFYEPNETTSIRGVNEIIREIGMEDFLKALYIGYEVESEFKVGDWIITRAFGKSHRNRALKIRNVFKNHTTGKTYCYFENADELHYNCYLDDIERQATPEEIAKEKQ